MTVKTRNWNAVDAHFRNSAGAMKDKRSPRGGSKNRSRDYIDDFLLEAQEEDSSVSSGYSSFFVCCDFSIFDLDMDD